MRKLKSDDLIISLPDMLCGTRGSALGGWLIFGFWLPSGFSWKFQNTFKT